MQSGPVDMEECHYRKTELMLDPLPRWHNLRLLRQRWGREVNADAECSPGSHRRTDGLLEATGHGDGVTYHASPALRRRILEDPGWDHVEYANHRHPSGELSAPHPLR